jgi:hypothetical protein
LIRKLVTHRRVLSGLELRLAELLQQPVDHPLWFDLTVAHGTPPSWF